MFFIQGKSCSVFGFVGPIVFFLILLPIVRCHFRFSGSLFCNVAYVFDCVGRGSRNFFFPIRAISSSDQWVFFGMVFAYLVCLSFIRFFNRSYHYMYCVCLVSRSVFVNVFYFFYDLEIGHSRMFSVFRVDSFSRA